MKIYNPKDQKSQQEVETISGDASQEEFKEKFSKAILEENLHFQKYIMETPQFQTLYRSNPVSSALRLAVGLKIGSLGLTADEDAAKQLIDQWKSQDNVTAEERSDLEFFEYYFDKLTAIRTKDKKEYDRINELIQLQANEGSLYAKFHIAQEFFELYNSHYKDQTSYKFVDNRLDIENKHFKREDVNRVIQYLLDFAAINPADSSYMIAELANQLPNDVVPKVAALNFYMLAASHNEPNSCYQLSLQ